MSLFLVYFYAVSVHNILMENLDKGEYFFSLSLGCSRRIGTDGWTFWKAPEGERNVSGQRQRRWSERSFQRRLGPEVLISLKVGEYIYLAFLITST